MKPLSIAQDIININWKGRKKMPRCTGLAVSLKSNVKSKEFITYLSKLGHILSYDDILQIQTTWANGSLEAERGYTTRLSNITPGSHLSKLRLILLIMVKEMHNNMQRTVCCTNIKMEVSPTLQRLTFLAVPLR